jgi:hypothetical protein
MVRVSFAGAVSDDTVAEIHPLAELSTEATRPVTAVVVPAVISNSRVIAVAPEINAADSVSLEITIVAGGAFGVTIGTTGVEGASALDEHWTIETVRRETAVERSMERRVISEAVAKSGENLVSG